MAEPEFETDGDDSDNPVISLLNKRKNRKGEFETEQNVALKTAYRGHGRPQGRRDHNNRPNNRDNRQNYRDNRPVCWNCGRFGHKQNDCREKPKQSTNSNGRERVRISAEPPRDEADNESTECGLVVVDGTALVSTLDSMEKSDWCVDSGSTSHRGKFETIFQIRLKWAMANFSTFWELDKLG